MARPIGEQIEIFCPLSGLMVGGRVLSHFLFKDINIKLCLWNYKYNDMNVITVDIHHIKNY
jgi:hypothetical protein